MSETFKFDEEFERRLLAFLVRDINFFLRNSNFVLEQHFTNQFYKDIYRTIKNYFSRYNQPISEVILRNEITNFYIKRQKRDVNIDEYFKVISELFKENISLGIEYTEDQLLNFVKNKEMENILTEGMERVLQNRDLNPILSNVTKILLIGNKLKLGYDYFKEAPARLAKLSYESNENVVPTGIKKLDRLLGGGLSAGEIGVIVAPSSRGKTAALVNFAYGAMRRRKNVIYVCLEQKVEDVGTRFDMLISQFDKDDLKKEYEKAVNHILYVEKLFKTKLVLQFFPTETVTVADIDQYISHEQIVNGFEADLIIIDSLNLCKRSNTRDEIWQGTNYREGKAIAGKRNRPLWTAAQAKDGSLTQKFVTPRMISEATIRIWSDSDVIIGLCQDEKEGESEEDEKTKPKPMRIYLGKNRNRQAKREIPIIFDPNVMTMTEQSISEQVVQ